jgi:hypothetical protein
MIGSIEGLIPIALFIMIAFVVTVGLQAWSRNKLAQQETLRLAIQSGQKIDETALKLMVKSPLLPEMDLRQGIISTCLAIGFGMTALFSKQMPKLGDLATVIGMIAILIASVGIGQLIAWKARATLTTSKVSDPE